MELHLSKFHQIRYNKTNKTLTNNWLSHSEFMTKAQYQDEITCWFELYNKYLPEYLFTDSCYFYFPISPDLQLWNSSLINKLENRILKKWAILISHDFFSQLSIEQTINESNDAIGSFGTTIQYFEDETEAKEWLFS